MPNYFGDGVVWWGFYLIALSAPGGAWTIFSPILMTVLPDYAEYAARTSAFIPRRPR